MFRRSKYDLSHIVNGKYKKVSSGHSINALIATWFYVGLSPIAPGTLGSLASYPLFYWILTTGFIQTVGALNFTFYITATLLFVIGWWATAEYQNHTKTMDHRSVVIDEVAGMMLAFALCYDCLFKVAMQLQIELELSLSPVNTGFLLVFAIFRFFDIRKPFFISYIDRYLKSALGVMLDDSLAAVYTAISIRVISALLDKLY